MKYTVDQHDNYCIFTLQEETLNSILAPDLKSKFVVLSNEGVQNLIFNLSNVKFVDSSGLSAILTANRLWKNIGSFVLTGIDHPSVQKLIQISRLNTVLTIIPTLEESVEYVMMEVLERELKGDSEEEDQITS